MSGVDKRDVNSVNKLSVIISIITITLCVIYILDSYKFKELILNHGMKTVIVEARDCKTNTFLHEIAGELECELIVVDHDNKGVYGFIYREFANTDDEVRKLDSLPDIVNGCKFEVTYDPNNVVEFSAKPVGYETVFDMIE